MTPKVVCFGELMLRLSPPGFERLPTSILLVALFVVGLEFLRGQAIKDFPDQTWEAGTARWQESGRSLFRRSD